MNRETQLLETSISSLRLVGVHPMQSNLGLYLVGFLTVLRFIYMPLIPILALQSNGDINVIIIAMQSFASYMQGINKLVALVLYKKLMQQLMNDTKHFWTDHNNDYKNWVKFGVVYKYLIISTYLLLVTKSILTKTLIFEMYIPDFPYAFLIMLIGQHCQFPFDILYVIAIDLFFVNNCALLLQQFCMINQRFEGLNEIEDQAKLRQVFMECIGHHSFLLRYGNNVIQMYCYTLLLHFFTVMYSICTQLYIFTEGQDTTTLITSVFYMAAMFAQISLYCVPSNLVADAATQVGHDIYYNFHWYNNPMRIQKYVPLIVQRSQKSLQFNAGGMIAINIEALTLVFKGALSFYTFIQQVKAK